MQKHKWKIIISLTLLTIVILPWIWIPCSSHNKIFTIKNTPEKPVVIVLGAGIIQNSHPSAVLQDRLDTAIKLYQAEKVQKIIMSGDNSTINHNEPLVMKNYALAQGVAESDIFLDYAGFRTHDTCARAKAIFDVQSAIIVTQKFHLPRAIFLCSQFDIDSVGVIADQQKYRDALRQSLRELVSKFFAFYEMTIFRHEPHFLGEKVDMWS